MKRALIQKGEISLQNINKSPLEKYLDYEDIAIALLCTMAHFNEAQSEQSPSADYYYDGCEQTSCSLQKLTDTN